MTAKGRAAPSARIERAVRDALHDCSWSPAFATGDDIIDSQHRAVMALLDNLLHAESCGRRGYVTRALRFLSSYVEEHFETEEDLMERVGFPLLETHRKEHQEFRRMMKGLQRSFAEAKAAPSLGDQVTTSLLRWMVAHLAGPDLELRVHLSKQKGGAAARRG